MPEPKPHTVVLASGGIDSTACINFYLKLNHVVTALFIDFGQLAQVQEFTAVKQIADFYSIKLTTIEVKNSREHKDGLILGRNAFFFFLALMNFKQPYGIIASGIHSGTTYYDCSEKFLDTIQVIFNEYSSGTIMVEAPFKNFNKKDIIEYCYLEGVPLNLTYSCEKGGKIPCGKCNTCKDLIEIYATR